ncbi:ATP-binding protein [Aliiglaciecola sp. CAU 1673]|uniref:sensor histidine kinase n=1 Tax=Aliiglaciecola sp. CAU 1673 TaxID=3032595 RepID=UPI0023DB9B7B|nr:ATP-binding protein [Aliiglaciecola sp. CAU 1673]MDF2179935.1 ATP-binding protein [Aliiglaciecola sp. CAU 1673]
MRSLFWRLYLLILLGLILSAVLQALLMQGLYKEEIRQDYLSDTRRILLLMGEDKTRNPQDWPYVLGKWQRLLGPDIRIESLGAEKAKAMLGEEEIRVITLDIDEQQDWIEIAARFEDKALLLSFDDSYSDEYMLFYYLSDYSGLIIMALLLLPLCLWLSRYLHRLSLVCLNLALGNYDHQAPPSSVAAMNALSTDINRLGQSLAAHQKRQLVFNAALHHETRIPLQRLRLALDMAQDMHEEGGDPVQVKALLKEMDEDIDELAELTEDMLLLARINHNKASIALSPLELDKALSELLMAKHWQGVSLLRSEPCRVRLSSLLFSRVVVNLVDNAQKFAASRVQVSLQKEGAYALLVVEDDGPGLENTQVQTLFEPFNRGQTQEDKPGLGLGLALVGQVLDVSGGQISLGTSSLGGARVQVRWLLVDYAVAGA